MAEKNTDPDDDIRYRVPIGEMGPVLLAAAFALLFIAVSVWLVFTPNPFAGVMPKAKQDQPAEVTVSVPEPAKK